MERFKPEIEQIETEQFKPATIRIEIFRHDDKQNPDLRSDGAALSNEEDDRKIRLTDKGRKHSIEAGREKNPHPEVGVVYGSRRDRSVETGLRQLLAEKDIPDDFSLEDIEQLTKSHLKVGRKYTATELLDFNFTGSEAFRRATKEHYTISKDLMSWYFSESDNLVKSTNDKVSTCYTRLAANVAELVLRYTKMYPRWEKIVSDEPDKYTKFGNELQRFMSTHLGVAESFLMKVIEKTRGKEHVFKFINSLKSKNGFDFSEGFIIKIQETNNGKLNIVLNFKQLSAEARKNWERASP